MGGFDSIGGEGKRNKGKIRGVPPPRADALPLAEANQNSSSIY